MSLIWVASLLVIGGSCRKMSRLWMVWLFVALTWLMLHWAHFKVRRLFLAHQISSTRSSTSAKSRALGQAWHVLQVVQKLMLVVCYGLVAAAPMVRSSGQAMLMLIVAIILAGACPDHWRRTGTLPHLYFEGVVIVACCSGVYAAASQFSAEQIRAEDSALLASLPIVCLAHYILVLRTRRSHMPLTPTAPLGALTQFLASELRLEARLLQAFESFHAACNINRIEASLERVGSEIPLALYDTLGHCLFGSLLHALACACLKRSKSWPLRAETGANDSDIFQSALQGWVIYGSLLCIQAALVGGVYSYYTVALRRFNPFTEKEGVVFNWWWSGEALTWVSRRTGRRWTNQIRSAPSSAGTDALSSSMVPPMAIPTRSAASSAGTDALSSTIVPRSMENPMRSVVGMLAWAQPVLDRIVGCAGAWLNRSVLALPITGHIRDSQTRAKAITDWPIKGFAHQHEISHVLNVLRNVVLLLNAETDDINKPLLEVVSGTVVTVSEWATYVLICAGERASWLLPMACALVRALERHNHREYTEAFRCSGNTRKEFRLFGKDGMLSRVMLYSVCVAGVSATWDATDEDDYLHITTAQCAVAILQLHNNLASIQGLVGKLEDDMVTVFAPDQHMRDDDTMAISNRFVSKED